MSILVDLASDGMPAEELRKVLRKRAVWRRPTAAAGRSTGCWKRPRESQPRRHRDEVVHVFRDCEAGQWTRQSGTKSGDKRDSRTSRARKVFCPDVRRQRPAGHAGRWQRTPAWGQSSHFPALLDAFKQDKRGSPGWLAGVPGPSEPDEAALNRQAEQRELMRVAAQRSSTTRGRAAWSSRGHCWAEASSPLRRRSIGRWAAGADRRMHDLRLAKPHAQPLPDGHQEDL